MVTQRTFVVLGGGSKAYSAIYNALYDGGGRAGWRRGGMSEAEVFAVVAGNPEELQRATNGVPSDRSFIEFDVWVGEMEPRPEDGGGWFHVPPVHDSGSVAPLANNFDDYLRRIDNDRAALLQGIDAQASRLLEDLGWVLEYQREALLRRVGELEYRVDLLQNQLDTLRAAQAEEDPRVRRRILAGVAKVVGAALVAVVPLGVATINANATRSAATIAGRSQVESAVVGRSAPNVNLDDLQRLARSIESACEASEENG